MTKQYLWRSAHCSTFGHRSWQRIGTAEWQHGEWFCSTPVHHGSDYAVSNDPDGLYWTRVAPSSPESRTVKLRHVTVEEADLLRTF